MRTTPTVNTPKRVAARDRSPTTVTAGMHTTATPVEVVDLNGKHVHGVKAQDVAAELQPDQPLDPATRALLMQQLTIARETAMRYPTVSDARGGRATASSAASAPGAGAHYIGGPATGRGRSTRPRPQSLIYDGTSPTSQIVGLMYVGSGDDNARGLCRSERPLAPPQWRVHQGRTDGIEVLFPVDAERDRGAVLGSRGSIHGRTTTWMVHAWVVPSWESPAGVFSHENPNLRCADGTYNTDAVGRCQGT